MKPQPHLGICLAAAAALTTFAMPAAAQLAIVSPIPALDDVALLGLSVIVGLGTGWAIKRGRRK